MAEDHDTILIQRRILTDEVFGRDIRQAVWLYYRFTLSFWDVEELLAARGVDVSYETVRC